jgi:hypothetical protein
MRCRDGTSDHAAVRAEHAPKPQSRSTATAVRAGRVTVPLRAAICDREPHVSVSLPARDVAPLGWGAGPGRREQGQSLGQGGG